MNDYERLYNLTQWFDDKYQKRLGKLAKDIIKDMEKELKKLNIPHYEKCGNGYKETKSFLAVNFAVRERLTSSLGYQLVLGGLTVGDKSGQK